MADFPQSGKWSLREHAHRLQGDTSYPTSQVASSVWSLTDVSRNEELDNWPEFIDAYGLDYANSYITTTGGSITTFTSTSGSIDTAIDNLSDGDVLLLSSGSYTLTSKSAGYLTSCPWRNKNILIAGAVLDANDVEITLTHNSERGKHIFAEASGTNIPTIRKQMAFLRLKRLATSTTSYINSLCGGPTTYEAKGRMVNCILDLNNGNVSWHYDNSGTTGHDVKFIRTTFINYNTWGASYSGTAGIIDVDNCLFDSTTVTNKATLTDCVQSATITTSNGNYSTASYATAGHLYVPNTTAVF